MRRLGAALAAGCTAIVKPSEETPASTEALIRLLDELPGLPPGVVNLVHGPGDPTGSALVAHPGVDMVSFTGSTATGRQIMAAAAGTLKRVSPQCSGKAPSLVFADCELEKALDALAYGAFLYGGQSCTAATRIIVERPLYDEFVERLAAGDAWVKTHYVRQPGRRSAAGDERRGPRARAERATRVARLQAHRLRCLARLSSEDVVGARRLRRQVLPSARSTCSEYVITYSCSCASAAVTRRPARRRERRG